MYYDYSKIDSYNCPIKIVVSRRGLGKTFGKIKMCAEKNVISGRRFIYVVETDEMSKELSRNNGEKFWANLLKYYEDCDTSRKRYFYNKFTELVVEEENENITSNRRSKTSVIGGTIKINGETAGYILSMNAFAELKRNNFRDIAYIIIDEFISEKFDKTTLENPRKISSLIQSVCRLNDIKIYMLANTVRKDDPILSRMGFKLEGYGWYYKRDDKGLIAILHFVDPKEYPDFAKAYEQSVAGRFAKMLGETNEENNEFIDDLPANRRLSNFKYKKGGMNLNIVKDNTIITLKELENGNIACVPFSRRPTTNLFCLTEKEQGYKLGYHIICNKTLKQSIMNMLRADVIYYYSEVEYNQLKFIIKGD